MLQEAQNKVVGDHGKAVEPMAEFSAPKVASTASTIGQLLHLFITMIINMFDLFFPFLHTRLQI